MQFHFPLFLLCLASLLWSFAILTWHLTGVFIRWTHCFLSSLEASVCGSTVGSLGVFSSILMLSEVLNVWGAMILAYGESVRGLVSVATLISY